MDSLKKFNAKTLRMISIFAGVLCVIIAIVLYLGHSINEENKESVKQHISIQVAQNTEVLEEMLGKHLDFLLATTNYMGRHAGNKEELLNALQSLYRAKPIYGFKRLGFIYPNGDYVMSNGASINVKYRDYFQRCLKGETIITKVSSSYALGESVNIIAVPVKNPQKEFVGVLLEAFPTSELNDKLTRGFFGQFASAAIVDEKNNLIAASNDAYFQGLENDLYSYLNIKNNQNHQNKVYTSYPDSIHLDRDGGLNLFYVPLNLNQRTITNKIATVVVVRDASIEQMANGLKTKVAETIIIVVMIFILGTACYFYENNHQKNLQHEKLHKVAYVDFVTGKDNYQAFLKKVSQQKQEGHVVVMSIDKFAIIQNVCGYKTGDQLLVKIHNLLTDILLDEAIVGHISSGLFCLFFKIDDAEEVSNQLYYINASLEALAEEENTPLLSASFGVASHTPDDDIADSISRARVALSTIADSDEKFYSIYGEKDKKRYQENSELEKKFTQNIAEEKFEIWYQPKYDPFNNAIMGAEALVRLRKCDNTLVPPYKFIPLFESDGLIRYLDQYVFLKVCELQKQRLNDGLPVVPISVNISRVSLHYPNVVEEYAAMINSVGILPRFVPLEITESATINIKDIYALTEKFANLGFKLHMDDFGRGYSSLSSLNVLPFSTIKVDKSLVDYIGEYSGNELVKHIVNLAKRLHLHVTVEGVETEEQVKFLKSINCHSIQGYYFCKPIERAEFEERLNNEPVNVMFKW